MNRLTKCQILWLAATIDTEGWIGCVKMRPSGRRGWAYGYGIVVGMTHLGYLKKLQHVTGLGTINPHIQSGNRKMAWVWKIGRIKDIHDFLLVVRPHLIVKWRQANALLALPAMYKRIPRRRDFIYRQLRKLNKKGR